jgi:hypothetical protein
MMRPGLVVAVVYADDDLIEVEIATSNGVFAGTVRAYDAVDAPTRWADALAGFPTRRSDGRDLVIGTFADDEAGGGVALRFSVVDGAGHCTLAVRLRADGASRASASAAFTMAIEPAAVDDFVAALRAMSSTVGAQATLAALPEFR